MLNPLELLNWKRYRANRPNKTAQPEDGLELLVLEDRILYDGSPLGVVANAGEVDTTENLIDDVEALTEELIRSNTDFQQTDNLASRLEDDLTEGQFLDTTEINLLQLGDDVSIDSQLDAFESMINQAMQEEFGAETESAFEPIDNVQVARTIQVAPSAEGVESTENVNGSENVNASEIGPSPARSTATALPLNLINNGGSVSQEITDNVSAGELQAFSNVSSSSIVYTVIESTINGTLELNGIETQSFTQGDINSGLLVYVGNEAASNDSFLFSVTDGQGNEITERFVFNDGRDNETPFIRNLYSQETVLKFEVGTAPVPIDVNQDAVVRDDQTNFTGGMIEFSLSPVNRHQGDFLQIINGNGIAVVGVSGNASITDNGVQIGTFNSNSTEQSLIIDLTSATPENLTNLLRQVHFGNGETDGVFIGDRTIQVAIDDGQGESVQSDVTLSVFSDNQPPDSLNATFFGVENQSDPIPVSLTGSDGEGSTGEFRILSTPENGRLIDPRIPGVEISPGTTLSVLGGGSLRLQFFADANFSGTTSFEFAAIDNLGLADPTPGLVSIQIAPNNGTINNGSVFSPGMFDQITSSELDFALPGLDRGNVDFTVTSAPANGAIIRDIAGNVVFGETRFSQAEIDLGEIFFLPGTGQTDPVSFVFTVSDGLEIIAENQVFELKPDTFNQAPVLSPIADQVTIENNQLAFNAANSNEVFISDVDAGQNDILVTFISQRGRFLVPLGSSVDVLLSSTNGVNQMEFTGTVDEINEAFAGLVFLPNAGFVGTSTVLFEVNDLGNSGTGDANVVSQSFTIDIVQSASPPATLASVFEAVEDGPPLAINLVALGDGVGISRFRINSIPASGTLFSDSSLTSIVNVDDVVSFNSTGAELFFRSDEDFNGTLTFEVAAIDGQGNEDPTPATQTITITPVNDPAVVVLNTGGPGATPGGGHETVFAAYGEPISITGTDPLITDVDSLTFDRLRITVLGDLITEDETFSADLTEFPGLSLVPNSSGIEILGVATIEQWEQVLSSITYQNSSQVTVGETRVFRVFIADQDSVSSAVEASITFAAPDAMILEVNNVPGTLAAGDNDVILSSELQFNSGNAAPDQIVFTITRPTEQGEILVNGVAATTFTQQDINDGLVSHQHDNAGNVVDSFEFTVNNGYTELVNQIYEFEIIQPNRPPVIFSLGDTATISENVDTTVQGFLAFQLTAVDPDSTDPLTWSIVDGLDSANFSLSGPDLDQLIFNDGITDFERQSSYSVEVQVTDSQGASSTRIFFLNVTDVNESPSFEGPIETTIDENQDLFGGVSVFALSATDPESADVTFSIATIQGDANFLLGGVNADQLILQRNTPFDFETDLGPLTVVVNADDGDGNITAQTFTINIGDVNEAPVFQGPFVTAINENQDLSGGVSVFALSAIDPESADVTYSIALSDGDANFSIGGSNLNQLIIQRNTPFDFESNLEPLTVVVNADDGDGNVTAQTFEIDIADVNESPVFEGPFETTVSENQDLSAGVTVFALSAADPETPQVVYSIGAILGDANFTLGGVNADQLILQRDTPFDFETNPGPLSVVINADDGDGNVTAQTFTINLSDVNENPVFAGPFETTIEENVDLSAGVSVFVLTAADPELSNVSFEIASVVGDANFTLGGVNADQLILQRDTPFDFETNTGPLSVVINADDGDGNVTAQTFTINLSDVNENPVFAGPFETTIEENVDLSAGVSVFALSASDDFSPQIDFSIADSNGDANFSIGGPELNQLILQRDTPFDFESNPGPLTVVVNATDGNGNITAQTFTIDIADVNEVPVFAGPFETSIDENQDLSGGVSVFELTAADPESPGVIFSIAAIEGDANFVVGGAGLNQLILQRDTPFDFETNPGPLSVVINADDGGGNVTQQTFTINIADVNESPAFAGPFVASIDENQDLTEGVAVFELSAADPESSNVVFSIAAVDGDANFIIGGVDSRQLILQRDTPFDFETNPDLLSVVINATDGDGNVTAQTFTVNVNDVNEGPVLPPVATVDFLENSDEVVTQVQASDPEANAVFYSLQPSPDADLFSIDSQGNVRFLQTPDFESPNDADANNQYEIVIVAQDALGLQQSQSLTINVVDQDETIDIATTEFSVPENQSLVGSVVASNVGQGTLVYSLDQTVDGVLVPITDGDTPAFSITADGVLSFNSTPDFESPLDQDGDNVYEVTVAISDEFGNQSLAVLTVTVTPENESPEIVGNDVFVISEGDVAVGSLQAIDVDGDVPVFSLIDNIGDAPLFSIDSQGALSFNASPDFENPNSQSGSNLYAVGVLADDGNGGTDTRIITVEVTNVNEAPEIDDLNVSVADGSTQNVQIIASDVDSDNLVYEIVDGLDSEFFQIDQQGNVSFLNTPDFDLPLDEDQDNRYRVAVSVSDNVSFTLREIEFTIGEPLVIPVIVEDATPGIDQETQISPISEDDQDTEATVDLDDFSVIDIAVDSPFDFNDDPQSDIGKDTDSDTSSSQDSDDEPSSMSDGLEDGVSGSSSVTGLSSAEEVFDAVSFENFIADDIVSENSVFRNEITEVLENPEEALIAIVARHQNQQLQELSDVKGFENIIASKMADGLAMVYDLSSFGDGPETDSGLGALLDLKFSFGAVTAVGTLGYILWSIRSGMLVALALTQLPTWQMIDPLPVLETYETNLKRTDDTLAGRLFS